jgi:hypothetical protein
MGWDEDYPFVTRPRIKPGAGLSAREGAKRGRRES